MTNIFSLATSLHSSILPKIKKEQESIFVKRLLWMKQLNNDPPHKKIVQTKDVFVDNDDFDPEEAMEAVVDKRKLLVNRLYMCEFGIICQYRYTRVVEQLSADAHLLFAKNHQQRNI